MGDNYDNIIPHNINSKNNHKYILLKDKNYYKIVELIYYFGRIIIKKQLIEIIKKEYEIKSFEAARKRTERIIQELEVNKFIKIEYIGRSQFIVLRTAGLAFGTKDYLSVNRLPSIKKFNNNRLITAMLKAEYYLVNNKKLKTDTYIGQLKLITQKILYCKIKYPEIEYDEKLLNEIIKEKDIKKIKDMIVHLKNDDLLKIIWNDLYDIFYKLMLQNHYISETPTELKFYIIQNRIKMHYIPQIIIVDIHDKKYYMKKIAEFYNLFNHIETNYTRNIKENYLNKRPLGESCYNCIGYTLKLIGYNDIGLASKKEYIKAKIYKSETAVLLDNAYTEVLNIQRYISKISRNEENFNKIDDYIRETVNSI